MIDIPSNKLQKLVDIHELTRICRDFYLGYSAVVNERYLPREDGESDALYRLRIASTAFSNLFAPIVDGLAGLITKREPSATGFGKIDFTDVDLQGSSLGVFVRDVCISSLIAGIEFVAVQTDSENSVFLRRYAYEDLMSYALSNGVLTQIVFKETLEQKDGEFGMKKKERYVVFKKNGGEIWYQADKGTLSKQEEWQNKLEEVPVVAVITGKERSTFCYVSRLLDIAYLNRVELNLESNLANALSIIGNPVAVFYGDAPEKSVKLNIRQGLVFEDKTREGFEYVEVKGTSVSKIEEKIKSITEMIDKLAFSLLQKTENRTVIDATENQSKNTSFLSMVAIELESKFNKLYEWVAFFTNTTTDQGAHIDFKKDFDDILYTDAQLKILYDLVMSGDLSRETLWEKLKTMKILPVSFDSEKEAEKLTEDTGSRGDE